MKIFLVVTLFATATEIFQLNVKEPLKIVAIWKKILMTQLYFLFSLSFLFFIYFETESFCVVQADRKLLHPSNLPHPASQAAGITGTELLQLCTRL